MIKLLAFDLDGTTLISPHTLPKANRKALLAAAEKGVLLAPATGRMRDYIPREVLALPVRYAITSNGGGVYDLETGRAVVQNLIPNDKACAVQGILDGYSIYIEYYSGGSAITRQGLPELARSSGMLPESKWRFLEGKDYAFVEDFHDMLQETRLCPEKINLPYIVGEDRREVWGRLEALGGLRLTSSVADNIEINSEDAHKGGALRSLAEQLGIQMEEVMAIGDNFNDVTMLEAAGCSVAMGNSSPEALAAAKYVTGNHDQGGLAEAVERFVLSGDVS